MRKMRLRIRSRSGSLFFGKGDCHRAAPGHVRAGRLGICGGRGRLNYRAVEVRKRALCDEPNCQMPLRRKKTSVKRLEVVVRPRRAFSIKVLVPTTITASP